MERFVGLFLAIACCFLLGSPANSADPYSDNTHDWSGFYIGGNAGYGFGDTNHQTTDNFGNFAETGDLSIEGELLGIGAGVNWQQSALVFGGELDVSYSGVSGFHTGVFNPGPQQFNCGASGCVTDVDWLGLARLRLGYAYDNVLPFIAGGVAAGDVFSALVGSIDQRQTTAFGWTIGGGVEVALDQQWSAKLEYLYVDLGRWNYEGNLAASGPIEAEARFSVVRAGINFAF